MLLFHAFRVCERESGGGGVMKFLMSLDCVREKNKLDFNGASPWKMLYLPSLWTNSIYVDKTYSQYFICCICVSVSRLCVCVFFL